VAGPIFEINQINGVAVLARDGIELMTGIYRPGAGGRFPAPPAFSPRPRQIQNPCAPSQSADAVVTTARRCHPMRRTGR
jgi:predicted acyl esterase